MRPPTDLATTTVEVRCRCGCLYSYLIVVKVDQPLLADGEFAVTCDVCGCSTWGRLVPEQFTLT